MCVCTRVRGCVRVCGLAHSGDVRVVEEDIGNAVLNALHDAEAVLVVRDPVTHITHTCIRCIECITLRALHALHALRATHVRMSVLHVEYFKSS